VPSSKFVVFAQNHDQIGNRMLGERLGHLVSLEAYKLASSIVLLSPYVPLVFMGDEYGETAPFQYFVSHSDPQLVEAVRSGRKEEFASFQWQGEPPDPQAEGTFDRSRLNHTLKRQPRHQTVLAFHQELLRLRKSLPALRSLNKDNMEVASHEDDRVLVVRRSHGESEVVAIFSFNDRVVDSLHALPDGIWHKRFDSAEPRWSGAGMMSADRIEVPQHNQLTLLPYGVLVYEKEVEE
jgi:maltooligosyltrehalose trehalohydrolase